MSTEQANLFEEGREDRPEKVLLVDGNNILSRATHAYISSHPDVSVEQDIAGSIMLWLNSLRRYVRSEKPDRVAVCFDPETRPAWRAQRVASYKADRPNNGVAMPVVYAVALTYMLGLEPREHPEAEADDLVAGLAKVHADLGHDVVIVSADKDLLQCLGPRVNVRRPGVKPEWWNESHVAQRYGVPPSWMAAYQALVGDRGDGVPGVKGIGKKRAKVILDEVGGPDDVVHHDKIAGKEGAGRQFLDALAVVTLPGCPDRYIEALAPVPEVVGCRDALGVEPVSMLQALGLSDEAELVKSETFWN